MRTLIFCLLCAGLSISAFADDDPYIDPDWGYSFNDPHYLSDNAPLPLKDFYDLFVPMLEARGSAESAYLREYAEELYLASKEVAGSLENGTHHQLKHFNRAARSLRSNCAELMEKAHGGQSRALYKEMRGSRRTL